MTGIRRALDRASTVACERILGRIAERVDPSHRQWIEAMGAELSAINGGWRKFVWLAGGVRLVWSLRWRREMAYGQRGLLTVGGTCAFGVVLGVFSVRMFTGDTNMNLLGLQLYFFLAGFLVGPATKSFVAGALIGLTSGILGVFSGFLMSSEVAWVNPLVYLYATPCARNSIPRRGSP